ncbi:hypothetical protein FVE85_7558 [Porphyridium purpureum]|uniref:Uncharacterized protein n=1 Tax=Porphyridium purpureum TaxID=35688 RepID=A0A5J4ZB41_PORPP|nr:hypothetical protein FVE85_7558 [Porphyridium purpureum]|eukprot:POR4890..scf295_1
MGASAKPAPAQTPAPTQTQRQRQTQVPVERRKRLNSRYAMHRRTYSPSERAFGDSEILASSGASSSSYRHKWRRRQSGEPLASKQQVDEWVVTLSRTARVLEGKARNEGKAFDARIFKCRRIARDTLKNIVEVLRYVAYRDRNNWLANPSSRARRRQSVQSQRDLRRLIHSNPDLVALWVKNTLLLWDEHTAASSVSSQGWEELVADFEHLPSVPPAAPLPSRFDKHEALCGYVWARFDVFPGTDFLRAWERRLLSMSELSSRELALVLWTYSRFTVLDTFARVPRTPADQTSEQIVHSMFSSTRHRAASHFPSLAMRSLFEERFGPSNNDQVLHEFSHTHLSAMLQGLSNLMRVTQGGDAGEKNQQNDPHENFAARHKWCATMLERWARIFLYHDDLGNGSTVASIGHAMLDLMARGLLQPLPEYERTILHWLGMLPLHVRTMELKDACLMLACMGRVLGEPGRGGLLFKGSGFEATHVSGVFLRTLSQLHLPSHADVDAWGELDSESVARGFWGLVTVLQWLQSSASRSPEQRRDAERLVGSYVKGICQFLQILRVGARSDYDGDTKGLWAKHAIALRTRWMTGSSDSSGANAMPAVMLQPQIISMLVTSLGQAMALGLIRAQDPICADALAKLAEYVEDSVRVHVDLQAQLMEHAVELEKLEHGEHVVDESASPSEAGEQGDLVRYSVENYLRARMQYMVLRWDAKLVLFVCFMQDGHDEKQVRNRKLSPWQEKVALSFLRLVPLALDSDRVADTHPSASKFLANGSLDECVRIMLSSSSLFRSESRRLWLLGAVARIRAEELDAYEFTAHAKRALTFEHNQHHRSHQQWSAPAMVGPHDTVEDFDQDLQAPSFKVSESAKLTKYDLLTSGVWRLADFEQLVTWMELLRRCKTSRSVVQITHMMSLEHFVEWQLCLLVQTESLLDRMESTPSAEAFDKMRLHLCEWIGAALGAAADPNHQTLSPLLSQLFKLLLLVGDELSSREWVATIYGASMLFYRAMNRATSVFDVKHQHHPGDELARIQDLVSYCVERSAQKLRGMPPSTLIHVLTMLVLRAHCSPPKEWMQAWAEAFMSTKDESMEAMSLIHMRRVLDKCRTSASLSTAFWEHWMQLVQSTAFESGGGKERLIAHHYATAPRLKLQVQVPSQRAVSTEQLDRSLRGRQAAAPVERDSTVAPEPSVA